MLWMLNIPVQIIVIGKTPIFLLESKYSDPTFWSYVSPQGLQRERKICSTECFTICFTTFLMLEEFNTLQKLFWIVYAKSLFTPRFQPGKRFLLAFFYPVSYDLCEITS